MVILRKILVIIAAIVFFSGLGLLAYIHISYADNMPKSPDPSTGRTHLLVVNHGVRVYVTEEEMLRKARIESFSSDVGGICFLVMFALRGACKTS